MPAWLIAEIAFLIFIALYSYKHDSDGNSLDLNERIEYGRGMKNLNPMDAVQGLIRKAEKLKKETEHLIQEAKTLSNAGIKEAEELVHYAKANWKNLITLGGSIMDGIAKKKKKKVTKKAPTKKKSTPSKPKTTITSSKKKK